MQLQSFGNISYIYLLILLGNIQQCHRYMVIWYGCRLPENHYSIIQYNIEIITVCIAIVIDSLYCLIAMLILIDVLYVIFLIFDLSLMLLICRYSMIMEVAYLNLK